MSIIIFMLVSFAITAIITTEYIFKWFRKIFSFKPFTCSTCMSVWVGFGLSIFFPIIYSVYISWFLYGCISYTTTRILSAWLSEKEIIITDD